MGLVDNDRVVGPQLGITLYLGQQDAVCYHPQTGAFGGLVGEPDLVTDFLTQPHPCLGCDSLRHRPGGYAPGLGVDYLVAVGSPPHFQEDLGYLGGLARPGLPRDDDHLRGSDGLRYVVLGCTDRQLHRVLEPHARPISMIRKPFAEAALVTVQPSPRFLDSQGTRESAPRLRWTTR